MKEKDNWNICPKCNDKTYHIQNKFCWKCGFNHDATAEGTGMSFFNRSEALKKLNIIYFEDYPSIQIKTIDDLPGETNTNPIK